MMWNKLLLSTAMLAAMCGPAAAATFNINGQVASVCTVTTASSPFNPTNAQMTSGVTAQWAANFTYTCNSPTGFTRTVTSANAGRLMFGARQGPAYTVNFTGANGLSSGASHVSLSAPLITNVDPNDAFLAGVPGDMTVTFGPAPTNGYIAGTYSDVITVLIAPQSP